METGKLLKLLALAFALASGLTDIPHAAVIIVLLGVIAGVFVLIDDAVQFLLVTLTLALVHGALGPLPVIGPYLTDMLAGASALFNAAACVVVLRMITLRLDPRGRSTTEKDSGIAT